MPYQPLVYELTICTTPEPSMIAPAGHACTQLLGQLRQQLVKVGRGGGRRLAAIAALAFAIAFAQLSQVLLEALGELFDFSVITEMSVVAKHLKRAPSSAKGLSLRRVTSDRSCGIISRQVGQLTRQKSRSTTLPR